MGTACGRAGSRAEAPDYTATGGRPPGGRGYDGPMDLARRIGLGAAAAAVVAAAWLAPLDAGALAQAEAGLKRALATFATARALNAVISVVKGTEVAVEPVGVGVVFTPGQVLDPLDDLVEQFSSLMLAASVAFGVEIALIRIGGHWAVSAALTALVLGWAAWTAMRGRAPPWLSRLFFGLLIVRFAVPVAILGSDAAFQVFLAKGYEEDRAKIELSSGQIDKLATPLRESKPEAPTDGSAGLFSFPRQAEALREWLRQNTDVRKRLEELKEAASAAVNHVVNLIVVFVLQTLVMPLLIVWGLLRLGRVLLARPGEAQVAS